MQRIQTPDNLFHDGDPFNGVQGTVVTAAFLNSVQEEIAAVIESAGITLDAAQSNQLLAAIRATTTSVNRSVTTVTTTGGTVILTAAQAKAGFIVVNGVLTSNVSIIFPAAVGSWVAINATTGNFTVNCYASGGAGVPVSRNVFDGIACDGTNIKYIMGDAATQSAVQGATLTHAQGGGSANVHAAGYTPSVTALVDGMRLTFQALNTNTGACTFSPNGLPSKPIIGGAHQALQGGEITAGGKVELIWHASLNSWVLVQCTGAPTQVATATKSQHAVPLAQVQSMIGLTYVSASRAIDVGSFLVDTSGGTLTLTLPAAPTKGSLMTFVDAGASWAKTNWTLARNGKTIMGQAADLVVNLADQQFSIWFNGSDWRLV